MDPAAPGEVSADAFWMIMARSWRTKSKVTNVVPTRLPGAPDHDHSPEWSGRARCAPERRSHRGQSRSLTDNASADPRSANLQVTAIQRHRLPKRTGTRPRSQTDPNGADARTGDYGLEGREHARGSVDVLPRTRRRSVHGSRNLSKAPAASLRDRLRRRLTEPACRQVRQQSGSGEGPGQGRARSQYQGDRGDGNRTSS